MKSNKLKVLLVHQGFELYGSDRSFLSFCMKQNFLIHSKTDIVLSKDGPLSNELQKHSYKVSYMGMGRLPVHIIIKNPLKYFLTLIKDTLNSYKVIKEYDFIYINTIAPMSWIIVSFLRNKKRCIHVREITSSKISKILSFFMYKNCKIIFNNIESKNNFKTFFKIDSIVVNNGVERLNPNLNSNGDYSNIFKKKYFNILIPGRINNWKGQDFILSCLKKNKKLLNKINWIFVGSTAQNQEWRLEDLKKIVDYTKFNNINFLGWRDDLNNLMFKSDLVIVPSVKPEPFGRVIIEAMSLGKIVLASNHGGPSNIIQNNLNGFLFNPSDIEHFTKILFEIIELKNEKKLFIQKNSLEKYNNHYTEKIYIKKLSDEIKKFIKENN